MTTLRILSSEIRINVDELTQEVSLVIVDFAYPDEIEEAKQMWRLQIADLKSAYWRLKIPLTKNKSLLKINEYKL